MGRVVLSMVVAMAIGSMLPSRHAASATDDAVGLAEQEAFRVAVDRVADSVVRIEPAVASASALGTAAEATPASGPSTGLVVGAEGWVLGTAFAVPDDVDQAIVVLADSAKGTTSRLAGRVVGRDLSRGLVLLKVEPPAALPAVTVAMPRDGLAVGQWTIAVGRGWDAAVPNVAVGVLSAMSRCWGRAVQTDAAVSPANYGGPLIDIRGGVIGVLAPLPADTAGMPLGTELYDSGIGFAVPMEDILRVLPKLQAGEKLVPGVLGISYHSRDPFTGAATVASSRPGSPAAKAGIRPGDTIIAADGRPISRIAELRHVLVPKYAGDTIRLAIERTRPEGQPQRIEMDAELTASLPPCRRAIVGIVPTRVAVTNDREDEGTSSPVVVEWLLPGSPAAKAGMARGTVVETVIPPGEAASPVRVGSASSLAGVLGGVEPGEAVTLVVKTADGKETQHRLETVALPAEVPRDSAARPEPSDAATVVKLEAPEVAMPPLAVIPSGEKTDPVGVLIYFGRPHGPVDEAEVAMWKMAANRHGVAVIVPGSTDPQRWGREDFSIAARSVDSLRSRRAIDRSRLAVAGSAAGGAFAWLAAEALEPAIRGVVMIDATLPRQAKVEPAEPGRFRWILFAGAANDGRLSPLMEADRARLSEAGYDVGILPRDSDETVPVEMICRFVEALGVL
ncbi:MAG: trypsin-like peptidase domain-containing protein [Planctomycetia bacterium]